MSENNVGVGDSAKVSGEQPVFTWIRNGIINGGALVVQSPLPGKSWFQAGMEWPGGQRIIGPLKMDLMSAMKGLNDALCEDSAQEMRDAGVV